PDAHRPARARRRDRVRQVVRRAARDARDAASAARHALTPPSPVESALGPYQKSVDARLSALDGSKFAPRLWSRDDSLWSEDPAHRAVARNRLGWLESPAAMRREADALAAFAAEVLGDGYTHAVLLGMGGSSLAPEVLRRTLGVRPGALDL